MLITCGSAKFSLPTMPVEDYPQLPQLPQQTGSIPADLFSEAISQVAVAAGKDDTLPMLTGIRVEIERNAIVLAATDRFRLAVRELEWSPANPDTAAAVLIPAKTLSESAKTLAGDATSPVELALGSGSAVGNDGLLGIVNEGRRTTTRLLDAEFPKFRQLLRPSTLHWPPWRSLRSSRPSSVWRSSPSVVRRSACSSPPRGCCSPPAATTPVGPRKA